MLHASTVNVRGAIAVRTLSQNDYSYGVFQTSHELIRVFSS